MIPMLQRIQKSPLWHAKRREGIGGSDWAPILSSMHPDDYKWSCMRRLFYTKIGAKPNFPEETSRAAMRGNILEPVVAELFKASTGCRFSHKRPKAKELWPGQKVPSWMIGNMDRVPAMPPDWRLEVLEIKTMNQNVWYDFIENGLSVGYKLQPQHYLGISGLDLCNVAVMWPDGIDFQIEVVPRDVETLKLMVDAGSWFMSSVVAAKAIPDRPPITEQRCSGCPFGETCLGREFFMIHEKSMADLSNEDAIYKLIVALKELDAQEKDAKKKKKDIEDQITALIVEKHGEGMEKFYCREYEIEWEKALGSRFYREEFLADNPKIAELVKAHTKFFPRRTFTSKVTKTSQARWDLKKRA